MSSHRRIVRTNSSEVDPIVLVPSFSVYVWRFFVRILSFISILIRIIWYWFERIFLVSLLLTLTIWLAWWLSQTPSLYRDWDSVDAILPTMTWSGDIVTVDNIRDHIWKTDTEFTLRYQKLSYDLNEIEWVDYIITPFSDQDGPAHTMLSFAFSWGRHIVISGEIRKERGESFDAIRGFLNQYELAYVVATEDDIIKLRTNYRKNQVIMYPIKVEKENMKLLFRSMLVRADKLAREPEFYNTLWNNCTTSILAHLNTLRKDKLDGWKYTLLSSHSDQAIYTAGFINTQLSLSGARDYYRIDELARSGTGDSIFSEIIHRPIK